MNIFGTPVDLVTVFSVFNAVAFAAFAFYIFFYRRRRSQIPISHKIAVLGLPKSGKTSLITGLFELIQQGVGAQGVRLHGAKTIEVVNNNLSRLESGLGVPPTTENEIFVYRFSFQRRAPVFFGLEKYDIELADFPGEYTSGISSGDTTNSPSSGDSAGSDAYAFTLFNKEFFSWIASSREFLFLIDMSMIFGSEDPRAEVATINSRVRSSWQIIEDATTERGLFSSSSRSVHLIFSIFDSLVPLYEAGGTVNWLFSDMPAQAPMPAAVGGRLVMFGDIRAAIGRTGREVDMTRLQGEPVAVLENMLGDVSKVFDPLISFFKGRVRDVTVTPTSLRLREFDVSRLGLRRILRAVLP